MTQQTLERRAVHAISPARSAGPRRCRRKFLKLFPDGFSDENYIAWEGNYKRLAHARWEQDLNRNELRQLMRGGEYIEAAARAVRIESRTNLLFSFEKIALRDAVKSPAGAKTFVRGLDTLLHGSGSVERRFDQWIEAVGELPRRQTRVMTWPLVTVFGFIARPDVHIFLKPNVTRKAAAAYDYHDFAYQSRPKWETYQSLLDFAEVIRGDIGDLKPKDMIDIQSFIWVMGSEEYD